MGHPSKKRRKVYRKVYKIFVLGYNSTSGIWSLVANFLIYNNIVCFIISANLQENILFLQTYQSIIGKICNIYFAGHTQVDGKSSVRQEMLFANKAYRQLLKIPRKRVFFETFASEYMRPKTKRIPTTGVTGGGYATLTIYTTTFYNDCTSVTFFRPHSFFLQR